MSTLKSDILSYLKTRKHRVENGGINGIPVSFQRFRQEFPCIEPKKYIVVTGATKSSKTQITNYLIVYNTVFYCYNHPDVIHPKIFFFPLEESKEEITLRFIAYLINYITKGRINISSTDLKSTDERKPVSDEILDIIENDLEFNAIFSIYDDIVTFYETRNPTGIFKTMEEYAKAHGTVKYRDLKFEIADELTNAKRTEVRQIFDRYEPDDPKEIIFWVVDHVGLLSTEKDAPTKKDAIEKLSDYAIQIRNKYGYTYVGVQQQNTETTNLEAFKSNKIRPTKDGLKDSKKPGEDCDVLIGMTCPAVYDLTSYANYDISKFKDNLKILEVVLNRGGRANVLCPLYHDGAINYYRELPAANETTELNKVYAFINKQRELKKLSAPATALLAWAKSKFHF